MVCVLYLNQNSKNFLLNDANIIEEHYETRMKVTNMCPFEKRHFLTRIDLNSGFVTIIKKKKNCVRDWHHISLIKQKGDIWINLNNSGFFEIQSSYLSQWVWVANPEGCVNYIQTCVTMDLYFDQG